MGVALDTSGSWHNTFDDNIEAPALGDHGEALKLGVGEVLVLVVSDGVEELWPGEMASDTKSFRQYPGRLHVGSKQMHHQAFTPIILCGSRRGNSWPDPIHRSLQTCTPGRPADRQT
jgi:hypothetical protein